MVGTKLLEFTEAGDTGKTKTWLVKNRSGERLGLITWKSTWRRYVFAPSTLCVFDAMCLRDLTWFIEAQMELRKKEK